MVKDPLIAYIVGLAETAVNLERAVKIPYERDWFLKFTSCEGTLSPSISSHVFTKVIVLSEPIMNTGMKRSARKETIVEIISFILPLNRK